MWSRIAFVASVILLMGTVPSCSSPTVPSPTASTVDADEMVGRPADRSEASEGASPRRGELWYHLVPREASLKIHLRLIEPASTTTLFLPGSWAGHDDFADRISVEGAYGPEGTLAFSVDRGQGRIDVEAGDSDWLELSYVVDTAEKRPPKNRFVPWSTDEAFFAYAPTFLVLPGARIARSMRDIPVEIHAPSHWDLIATWPLASQQLDGDNRQISGFVAEDIRALRDAFVGGGQQWTSHEQSLSDAELTLTLGGDFAVDEQALLEATAELTANYVERFGGYHQVAGLILPLPADASNRRHGSGRRGGFVLEIPTDHPLDDDLLLLIAHEAFHMWNGHRLIPDADARSQTIWFMEGVTHYVALKTLSNLGLVDDRFVRSELAQAGQFYRRNPLVTGGEVRSVDRTRLPYDRGLLIAVAIDVSLRKYSGGELAVEDWLSTLLSPEYIEEARAYDLDVLRAALADLVDDVATEPLDRYDALVYGEQTIPVGHLFRQMGLHYLDASGDDTARLLPMDGEASTYEALFRSPE